MGLAGWDRPESLAGRADHPLPQALTRSPCPPGGGHRGAEAVQPGAAGGGDHRAEFHSRRGPRHLLQDVDQGGHGDGPLHRPHHRPGARGHLQEQQPDVGGRYPPLCPCRPCWDLGVLGCLCCLTRDCGSCRPVPGATSPTQLRQLRPLFGNSDPLSSGQPLGLLLALLQRRALRPQEAMACLQCSCGQHRNQRDLPGPAFFSSQDLHSFPPEEVARKAPSELGVRVASMENGGAPAS